MISWSTHFFYPINNRPEAFHNLKYNTGMDHFIKIYREHARSYHVMIEAEDADNNLQQGLDRLFPRPVDRLLDLGTGTGRLALMLSHKAGHITGLDLHTAMLQENRNQRRIAGKYWNLIQGNMAHLPFADRSFDAVTAGWAIGHLTGWLPDTWRDAIQVVLGEMSRVAAPGGLLAILETLTTGAANPAPPTPALGEYYDFLEGDHGFNRITLSTDYAFQSPAEAARKTEFFFGPDLAGKIIENQWARVPEWTGLWTKRMDGGGL